MSVLHREDGFSSPILIAVFAFMVLFIGGVSVDLWRVLSEHREVAGLVDGAAIAGATALDVDALYDDEPARLDPVLARDRVCQYMAFHDGLPLGDCPGPQLGLTVGLDVVTVSYERDVPLTLLNAVSLFGGDTDPIAVSAVSEVTLQRGVP